MTKEMILVLGLLVPSTALAQSQVVLLARTCLREAGWKVTDDCAAIHGVITERVRTAGKKYGYGYESMILAYSKPKPQKSWIDDLDQLAEQPASWPAGTSWQAFRGYWVRLLAHAWAVLDGEIKPACQAEHWGDQLKDRERAERHGWQELPCGNSLNAFWLTRLPAHASR